MDKDQFFKALAARTGYAGQEPPPPPRWEAPRELFFGEQERLEVFIRESEALGVSVSLVPHEQAAREAIGKLVASRGYTRVVTAPNAGGSIDRVDHDEFAAAQFGLCRADHAVAETGSIVLETGPHNPRCVSLLPPVAGFLVPRSKIVSRVGEVLTEVSAHRDDLTSCLNFISGPSKTADIEHNLCVGVHGPGEVHVWIIENL
ncbi:MAG: lactate utilization protein [Deltaproteobacteria bacterium]|nr:lactate utilization protein [Deltaproteobacteria bacterium]